MNFFEQLSLKNKIFLSCLGFVLLVSLVIALFTRWLLISSLTSELKRRGVGIAQSVADSSRVFMLTKNRAELTALAFDTRQGNRMDIIWYALIRDGEGKVLAHTFTKPLSAAFEKLIDSSSANLSSITEIELENKYVFNVTEPIQEGIYTIGSVSVGIDRQHIEKLIAKLRFLFLSFLSAVTILFFFMSNLLARYITSPVEALIRYTDQISKGNYTILSHDDVPMITPKPARTDDELKKLTDSFIKMMSAIRLSRMKLEDSEVKYRSLFTSGPNPIFVIDQNSLEILDANPMVSEVYGYTMDQLRGMPFFKLGSLDKDELTKDSVKEKNIVTSAKVKFFTKSGKTLYMNLHTSPAKYRDRDALIIATADITELVEKDTQLIQASKMTNLEKMSAGIAHELNQPLNAIKMGSEFLLLMNEKKFPIDDNSLAQVSSEISTQVSRAAEIVNRLREFSRKADFARDIIDINNCIRSVNSIVGRQLKLQNIDLVLDLDSTLPPVLAQNNRIEQVIFNLVTNARDAIIQRFESQISDALGSIKIKSWEQDNYVTMSVTDNGTGISEHDKGKIFETFYTTKEMGEGMGLGLPIIKGIIKDFGGTITFDSDPGFGTVFIIRLPSLQTQF